MQQLEQQANFSSSISSGNASSGLRSLLQETLNTMNANFLRLLAPK